MHERSDQAKIAVCPCCGKGKIDGDRYCRFCGKENIEDKYVEPSFACVYGPMPVRRIHRCEECGFSWQTYLMVDDEKFCPKCGGIALVEEKKKKWWDRRL